MSENGGLDFGSSDLSLPDEIRGPLAGSSKSRLKQVVPPSASVHWPAAHASEAGNTITTSRNSEIAQPRFPTLVAESMSTLTPVGVQATQSLNTARRSLVYSID